MFDLPKHQLVELMMEDRTPRAVLAWTAADATEKPSLQRQSPEQAATDSSALRQEPTEDPPQWTTPRARHNAQTGIVTCSTLVSSAKRGGRLIPEGGSKVSDQVAAAFSLAGVVGVGSCGGAAVTALLSEGN